MINTQKFWAKVVADGDDDQCWLWTAGTNADGYGRFRVDGKKKQAHHVAFFIHHGRWPMYVLHSCDNPSCVNWRHLSEGTHKQNIRECWAKGRGRKGKFFIHLDRCRDLIACGVRNRDICTHLGVPNDFVSRVRHGTLYA